MKKYAFIIFVLIVATILRIWNIVGSPSGLNADEAALGYNAYSLMLTGKDEHGHFWPVNLESFGDFKPAGYAYLLIPFIKVFGLTEFAVRLPSVIFGVLGVLGIYLLMKEISDVQYSMFSAMVLAINPWHIHFSRGAWEVNVSTTLVILGVWFLVKWHKNSRFLNLVLGTLHLVLSMYFYQSSRLIAPLLGLGIFILYIKTFRQNIKQLVIALIFVIVLLIPLASSLLSTDAKSRFTGVGLFADAGPTERAKELRGQHTNWNSPISRMLHNRPVQYGLRFVQNYLDHFDGNFLFVNGDVIERNKVPEMGLFYLTDAVFFFFGIYFLLKSSIVNHKLGIILVWLLLSPLAAAMTFQTPHALRAHNMVIPLTVIISLGMYSIFNKPIKIALGVLLFTIYLWQFGDYWNKYYVRYPLEYPAAWEYGFKELVSYTESVKDRYSKILVTDKYDQPYILFLFYSLYDPAEFQGNHVLTPRDKYNFSTVLDFDKYHFERFSWDKVRNQRSSLIVAAPEDVLDQGANVIKTINFPNGLPFVKIIEN